jgi:hypothetical protein
MRRIQNKISELFTILLTLLFVGLKLGGVIGWSWWWVFAPLWLPFVGLIVLGFVFFGIYVFWDE